jgi:hypothetical protein
MIIIIIIDNKRIENTTTGRQRLLGKGPRAGSASSSSLLVGGITKERATLKQDNHRTSLKS